MASKVSLRERLRSSNVVERAETGTVFFLAEDGIRDDLVTGVQTCALPISLGDLKHEIEVGVIWKPYG